ncbi:L-2-hydroxyglutarate oxidase [Arthrobacter sp. Br18]|uniref:L-2-hydroxyglutarate oxidase n=1 Tax=Arthrobacter sp. Br18 TaxID=1312954 RepID=UPI00047A3FA7|nr:L-2-hydroxyglutarate oxidase [Arthrobacter sp. Br18]
MKSSVAVVGAGIVGLATAYELGLRGYRVRVIEKESRLAEHQTGNNSGVIHSGLYYAPGSLKATLGTAGAQSMHRFAEEHGVPVDICGKLVVATRQDQLPALEELHRRGIANGVPCRMVTPEEARVYEPHVACVAALRVESTGIVDYRGICAALGRLITEGGGDILLGREVTGISGGNRSVAVSTTAGDITADELINCAGLHSDRIARLAGLTPEVRIIPFRGEYFELTADQSHLVRGLIYPVPDPSFPFLGVHLTKMVGGGVHAGPNAVFALAREGYTWLTINPRDVLESAAWPGLWKLGTKFWKVGLSEVARSLSRKKFLASLRELVPELGDNSLVPTHAGVRAQAMRRNGDLVDDFYFERAPRQIHVLNAPSPAATAALEIGRRIADELEERNR